MSIYMKNIKYSGGGSSCTCPSPTAASEDIHFKLYTTSDFEATHPGVEVSMSSYGSSSCKYGTKTLMYCCMYDSTDTLLYSGYLVGGSIDAPSHILWSEMIMKNIVLILTFYGMRM